MVRTVIGDGAVYPVVAATAGATVVAWTSGTSTASTIQVRRVPFQEPRGRNKVRLKPDTTEANVEAP